MDITRRKQAEAEAQRQRGELAHLSRVADLGMLSGSLAHELNQPLGSILANAEAAEFFLQRDAPISTNCALSSRTSSRTTSARVA
jgi:C4-dicarboxylate-specific signal transduction histidine kinase